MLRKLLTIFGVVTLSIWANTSVYAAAIINVDQVGSDVVATITGSIDKDALTPSYTYSHGQYGIIAGADNYDGLIGVGESATVANYYTVAEHHDISTSPLYFHATSNTGGHFQIREVNYSDQGVLSLPSDYVSNSPINSTSTWSGNTIVGMGLISGTYLYRLGNGETITLNIGQGSSPDPTYSVGGTVSGLTGTGLALQNNGGDTLAVAATAFTFTTELLDLAPYAVTVSTQPAGQACSVTGGDNNLGGGAIAGADVTSVIVTCVTDVVPTYSVGGTVSGLTGTGLALQNNGGDTLAVAATAFTFATELLDLAPYAVTVSTQPAGQACSVTGGDNNLGGGAIAGADVTSVIVTCVTDKADQTITGFTATPSSGAVGGTSTLSVSSVASVASVSHVAQSGQKRPTTKASGIPVTFGSNTLTICTVSGSTVSYLAIGTCTVTADQAGDANYNPAPQVTLDINVTATPPAIPNVPIPTLSQWGLVAMFMMMLGIGGMVVRRKTRS